MEKSIRLSTKRLILREFQAADWKAVLEWDADPDVVRYLTWDSEHTVEAAREHVRQQIMQSTQQPRLEYSFVIALPDTEQPIGSIDLHLRDDQLSAWVAYRLHPAYRRQGYATEALRWVLQFSFESLHLHRISTAKAEEHRHTTNGVMWYSRLQHGVLRVHPHPQKQFANSQPYG